MSDADGSFVFLVGHDEYHVPFTMTRMDDGRVKVVLHTEKFGQNKIAVDMHISTLLKGKAKNKNLVLHFYVTSQEFDNFKKDVINKKVKWVVAREPIVIPNGSGLIDTMHKTVDRFNAMLAPPPGPVTIDGTWISDHEMSDMGSMGGRRRSYKKHSSHKKRKSQKKCSSHKNHKRSSSKSHHRRHH